MKKRFGLLVCVLCCLTMVLGGVPSEAAADLRQGHTITPLSDSEELIAGGDAGGSAELRDRLTGSITPLDARLAVPRTNHAAVRLPDGSVLLVGGYRFGTTRVEGSAEIFDPATRTFSKVPGPRAARVQPSLALRADGLLAVRGGDAHNTTELFDPATRTFMPDPSAATVSADRSDYAPGQTVTLTGRNWQPGELVTITLRETPDVHDDVELPAFADANGDIRNSEFAPDERDRGVTFEVTARGAWSRREARTIFTDGMTAVDYYYVQNWGIGVAVNGTATHAAGPCDDCVFGVYLPFPVTFYNQVYTTGMISTNGVFQFGTASWSTAFMNTGLPAAGFGPSIFAFWDDLRLEPGDAIYTGVVGEEPNRAFIIEWRAHSWNTTNQTSTPIQFALRMWESSNQYDVIYGHTRAAANPDDISATVGLQQTESGPSTYFQGDRFAGFEDNTQVSFIGVRIPQSITTVRNVSATVGSGTSVRLRADITNDDGSQVTGGAVHFHIDGTAVTLSGVNVSNGIASFDYLGAALSSVGDHTITAYYNLPGGKGSSGAGTLTVVGKPTATSLSLFLSPGGFPFFSEGEIATLRLTVSASTGFASGLYDVRDGGVIVGTVAARSDTATLFRTSPLAAGAHSFTATFVPEAGSVFASSASSPLTLTVAPNQPPTADAGPDQQVSTGPQCTAAVTLNGSGMDPEGGALTYLWTGPLGSANTASPTFENVAPGQYTFTLSVSDPMGRSATDSVLVTVADTTPPDVILSPINVHQNLPGGAMVTLPGVSPAPDCGGPVTISTSLPSGLFPVGTTMVTYTATDASGNTSAPQQLAVTVTPALPPAFTNPQPGFSLAVVPGTPVSFTVAAVDPDADGLVTLGVTGLPAGAAFTVPPPSVAPSTTFAWTPTAAMLGTYNVTFTATDNAGLSAAPRTATISVVLPPAFSLPYSAPPDSCVCTPLIMNTNTTGTQRWYVRANGGPLSVTATAVSVNSVGGGSVVVRVPSIPTPLLNISAQFPNGTPPGVGASTTGAFNAVAGQIYELVVSTPASQGQGHFRLKIEGGDSLGSASPSAPSFEGMPTRWYVNVGAGETLDVSVLSSGTPSASSSGTYRLTDPTGTAVSGTVAATNASPAAITGGAVPGTWILDLQMADHYRLDKTTGTDRGLYLRWDSSGSGQLTVRVSSPTAGGAPFFAPVTLTMRDGSDVVLGSETFNPAADSGTDDKKVGHYTLQVSGLPEGWTVLNPVIAFDVLCDRPTVVEFVVADLTPPVLTVPPDITLEATGPLGAEHAYDAGATDAADQSASASCIPVSGSTFPVGVTTVVCTSVDASQNQVSGSFTVTVVDTTPPVLDLPPNATIEATGPQGAVHHWGISASDIVDTEVAIVCAIPSGTLFPVGTTTVNCLATDDSGNSTPGSFTVAVVDTVPPVLTMPADATLEATSPAGAAHTFLATATDVVDTSVDISCSAASGSTFALGTTDVTCTATDDHGNSTPGSFTVTVVDTTPPELTLPSGVTLEATGPAGAAHSWIATATDSADPDVAIACSRASGSTFSLGTTVVTCTATDDAGNSTPGSFTVTVVDTTAPVLTLPPDVTIEAASAAGASYAFAATATDLADPDVSVACTPASGSRFVLGATVVTCTATDDAGHTTTGSFTVTVTDTTAPLAVCTPGVNPSGANVPRAAGQNEDGFYFVRASDTVTGAPTIRLGSFTLQQGETIKLTQSRGTTGVVFVGTMGKSGIRHFRVGPGDPTLTITDAAGNTTQQVCYVPPVPK